jgi:hypothetical protein
MKSQRSVRVADILVSSDFHRQSLSEPFSNMREREPKVKAQSRVIQSSIERASSSRSVDLERHHEA